jgi:hypothetical protein
MFKVKVTYMLSPEGFFVALQKEMHTLRGSFLAKGRTLTPGESL